MRATGKKKKAGLAVVGMLRMGRWVQLLQDAHMESQLEGDICAKLKEGQRIIPGDI